MKVLIVTWSGGGASQPAVGIGRLLRERNHDVRFVAPAAFAPRVAAAGCRLRAFPAALEFDPAQGRAFEDQPSFGRRLFFGPELRDAVAAEVAAEPVDVVVVDFLLRSVVCLAEALPVPSALLIHMAHHHHGGTVGGQTDVWSPRWQYEQVNATRAELGLQSLPVGPQRITTALVRRAASGLVVMTREFDPWPDPPATVVHVGPIVEEAVVPRRDSLWAEDDRRPLVVVSMSTMYMHHEGLLHRVAEAAASFDTRVLVLSGPEVSPAELSYLPGVEVRRYVPHAGLLPDAALVVSHGGMGTLMAAFTAGVPTLCLPLGRDQEANARRAQQLGAATALAADADPGEIRRQIGAALASARLRAGARRMLASVQRYRGGVRATEALESLVASDRRAGRFGTGAAPG